MESQEILIRALQEQGLAVSMHKRGINEEKFTYVSSPNGNRLVISWKKYKYPFSSASAYILSLDKSAAYDHVATLGHAVPRSWYGQDDAELPDGVEAFLRRGNKVIVKPLDSGLGKGLTINITEKEDLMQALDAAKKHSDTYIIQQQFEGEEYRFVVVEGVARAVIMRQKPFVVGDGTSTVEQLVVAENENRRLIEGTMVTYPLLTEELIGDSAKSQQIPSHGERVELGLGTMISKGASIYDITNRMHESYMAIASDIGASIGSGFVVVDMMIQNHLVPAAKENYIFLEYNMSPALRLFYSCRDGRHLRVAEEYLAPGIARMLA